MSPLRERLADVAARVARAALREPLFVAAFGSLAMVAAYFGIAYPLGPGQDVHYHFFNAAVVSRLWTGDGFYRALYHTVSPLDSNTLLYTFLFPFELALPPLAAWRVGVTLYYFVGYPVACAVSLRLLRRPLWGAVLAFPLAYAVKTYSQGGYMPFVSSAPMLVLAIALLHRVNEGTATRRMQVGAALVTSLAFIAHAHAYAWLMVLLASGTLLSMGTKLFPEVLRAPRRALLTALVTGVRALVIVLPSLGLFVAWYMRTHHGQHADASWTWTPMAATLQAKVTNLWALLVHVQGERELELLLGLGLVVFASLALQRRRRETGVPTAELSVVLTFVSWWVLPADISGQMVADRHMDLLVWLLPLAVYAGEWSGGKLRHALAVSLLVGYAWLRLAHYGGAMKRLQVEYAGLVALGEHCPAERGELAYVTSQVVNAEWYGKGLHQAHETLAAMCRLDTPVYDHHYPHNLLPLRYKGELPAPITILVGKTASFWTHPGLFRDFDYVLVQGWRATDADVTRLAPHAALVRREGVWSLWRRPDPPR